MALVQIPSDYKFVAVTIGPWDGNPDDHVVIMGWPQRQRAGDGGWIWVECNAENIEARIAKEGYPAKSWRIVEYWDLPESRTYRDALRDKGTHIGHDIDLAKNIHLTHVRNNRAEAFPQLDAEWMKNFSQGKKKEADAVEAKRQAWRDLPAKIAPAIAAATTITELEAIPLRLEN